MHLCWTHEVSAPYKKYDIKYSTANQVRRPNTIPSLKIIQHASKWSILWMSVSVTEELPGTRFKEDHIPKVAPEITVQTKRIKILKVGKFQLCVNTHK